MRRRCHLIAAAAVLAASAAPVLACDATTIVGFAGEWAAEGAWRATAGGTPERVRCRATFAANASGLRVDASGRCASAEGGTDIGGWLECRDGALFGPLFTIGGERADYLADVRAAGSGLHIEVTAIARADGAVGRYALDLGLEPDAMQMTFTAIDVPDGRFHSADLMFRRR